MRPHEFIIENHRNGISSIAARVLHVNPTGSRTKVELRAIDFDLVISAAGYNAFHELCRFGVPALYVPIFQTPLKWVVMLAPLAFVLVLALGIGGWWILSRPSGVAVQAAVAKEVGGTASSGGVACV